MANRYYNGPDGQISPFTRARAEAVSQQFQAIAEGFDLVGTLFHQRYDAIATQGQSRIPATGPLTDNDGRVFETGLPFVILQINSADIGQDDFLFLDAESIHIELVGGVLNEGDQITVYSLPVESLEGGSYPIAVKTLAELKARPVESEAVIYDGVSFEWTPGDYTGQADDVNAVQANGIPLSTGAWVRQGADKVASRLDAIGAITRSQSEKNSEQVSVFDFMTPAQISAVKARTRLVDVTEEVQAAIDNGPGRLFFPPGDYPVTPGGLGHALLVDGGTIEMFGRNATIFMASTGNHQALRLEDTLNSTLRGLRFEGSGTDGVGGGQGLVQVFQGSNFTATDCAFDEANCDGLAVAAVTGVSVVGCSSDNASKGALYVNNSTGVRVIGNTATNFGGHTFSGNVLGVGLQLSGNTNLVAQGNTVRDGVGIGILCDNSGANIPKNNLISGNTVEEVSNPTNPGVSSGVRLQNDQASKNCGTVVSENVVRACGLYNFYIENHNGVIVRGNTGIESQESNYIIASVVGGTFKDNVAINTDTTTENGQAAFNLINGCSNVSGDGNRAMSLAGFAASTGFNGVLDGTGNDNRVSTVREYDYAEFAVTWHPNAGADIAAGGMAATDIPGVSGFGLGCYIEIAAPYTLNDCIAIGYFTGGSSARITLFNASGATRAFASGSWTVRVFGKNK